MKALPEYSDIVETRSARATDTSKLKYYNTSNINYWYDKATEVLCDKWKIAKRNPGFKGGEPEITWDTDMNRVLFIDETAIKDRNEAMRIANKFKNRITRCCLLLHICDSLHRACIIIIPQSKKRSERSA